MSRLTIALIVLAALPFSSSVAEAAGPGGSTSVRGSNRLTVTCSVYSADLREQITCGTSGTGTPQGVAQYTVTTVSFTLFGWKFNSSARSLSASLTGVNTAYDSATYSLNHNPSFATSTVNNGATSLNVSKQNVPNIGQGDELEVLLQDTGTTPIAPAYYAGTFGPPDTRTTTIGR